MPAPSAGFPGTGSCRAPPRGCPTRRGRRAAAPCAGTAPAISGSWVTMTTVWPPACSSRISAMMSSWWPNRGCRSVRRPAGSTACRPARARSPPAGAGRPTVRWAGGAPAAQADALQRLLRQREAFAQRDAAVDQRLRHVVERARARQQVKALEDEADLLVAHARQVVAGHGRDLASVEPVLAAARRSRQPTMFIMVDLPEPEAPMKATISLRPMCRSTPCSACTVWSPIWYCRSRPADGSSLRDLLRPRLLRPPSSR
jgi:hypothetical protein